MRSRVRRRPDVAIVATIATAAIAVAFLAAPLVALAGSAPLERLGSILLQPATLDALRLSAVTSLAAMSVSLVLGVPTAWVLVRTRFPGRALIRALTLVPLVLPPVVGGVALLSLFGRSAPVGRMLESAFGLTLFGRTAAVVIAQAFIALPFVVLTVEAGLRSIDARYEEASATLGGSPGTTWRRVTLPLVVPSIAAAAALSWARALGEFGATITFAGNLPGATQTMPLAVFVELQRDLDPAVSLSLILLAVSVFVLVLLRSRWPLT